MRFLRNFPRGNQTSSFFVSALLFCLFFSPVFANAKARQECGRDLVGEVRYSWCIDVPSANSTEVIYFLHGAGGNEKQWMSAPIREAIERKWRTMGFKRPAVISVSFGPFWLLSNVQHVPGPTFYQLFVETILPHVEEKLKNPVKKRMLAGASMGGFNAFQLFVRDGHRFDRVLLHCPMIVAAGPHAPSSEVDDFLKRHEPYVRRDMYLGLLDWLKGEFATIERWEDHDPIARAKKLGPELPRVLVTGTDRDNFGFHEGSEIFVQEARAQGVRAEWLPDTGGHCEFTQKTVDEIAHFFAAPK